MLVSGKKSEALKVLNELKQMSGKEYVPAYHIALIYAGLGEKDEAFNWLEQAYMERSFNLVWLKSEPMWQSLRSDPQFTNLLQHIGLGDKAAERHQAIHSVAVLPFQNVGGDPKAEFLCDGVADQIINSLSQVRRQNLKVRPFTSVARYKGKAIDIQTFGRELNVQMIVTGTLRQQGDDLTINVALLLEGNNGTAAMIWDVLSQPAQKAAQPRVESRHARIDLCRF
jgi:TolB-like protein